MMTFLFLGEMSSIVSEKSFQLLPVFLSVDEILFLS